MYHGILARSCASVLQCADRAMAPPPSPPQPVLQPTRGHPSPMVASKVRIMRMSPLLGAMSAALHACNQLQTRQECVGGDQKVAAAGSNSKNKSQRVLRCLLSIHGGSLGCRSQHAIWVCGVCHPDQLQCQPLQHTVNCCCKRWVALCLCFGLSTISTVLCCCCAVAQCVRALPEPCQA